MIILILPDSERQPEKSSAVIGIDKVIEEDKLPSDEHKSGENLQHVTINNNNSLVVDQVQMDS